MTADLAETVEHLRDLVERLNVTIAQQQGQINSLAALTSNADGPAEPVDPSAFDGWQRTLLLNRELERRVREVGEAERLLRSVVDSLDSRMCILGGDGRIVGVNRLWTALAADFGWDPAAADAGGDFFALLDDFGPRLARPVAAALRRALAGEPGDQAIKGPLPVAGRDEYAIVRIHPVRDHDVATLVVTVVDITEAHHTQQELDRVTAESTQASRLESIGQLAAGIAHEINTPVQFVSDNTRFLAESFGGVMVALELARELPSAGPEGAARLAAALDELDLDFLGEEIPAAISQSREGLDRVAQIVRAMKDFSHPGVGRSEADVNRAVESTVQVCRNEWRYVASLSLELDPTVGQIPCYEGELKQVLLNIVVNAAQAIAEQRAAAGTEELGQISVVTSRLPDAVRIAVADDGPGIPQDVQRRIFDPFFTTKPVGKGTGQGLSMAYASIVTKHGGTLTVDSTPGTGTTFTLTLPA